MSDGYYERDEFDQQVTSSLVRPYARTGGRTRPVHDLDLEALVSPTAHGLDPAVGHLFTPEQSTIIEMSQGTLSIAEVAARLSIPLGVARVIVADMIDMGLVQVMNTSGATGDERDPDFLRRVLSGLQRL